MKTATVLRVPKPSWIMLLNVAALGVLALVLSNEAAYDHKSEIDSAVRASRKMVAAVVANRDLGKVGPGMQCVPVDRLSGLETVGDAK
jgi:hypothetical protein